jgi:hypothetical protein
MKVTFEGNTFQDVLDDMESILAATNMSRRQAATTATTATTTAKPQGPGPDDAKAQTSGAVDKPETPVDKPVDKMAKVRAARGKAKPAPAPEPEPDPLAETAKSIDPVKMVEIRTRTIEDLQHAYANGKQQEVFELLSRFGNGAKSFRELTPDAFLPIREAIDLGALT